jgi:RNA polymerase sigma-54 factor
VDSFQMRLDALQAAQQAPVITYRQIAAVRLLQLSSQELEAAVTREQVENPALEAEVHACCGHCGRKLDGPGADCTGCGAGGKRSERMRGDWDDLDGGGPQATGDDDESDAIFRVPDTTVRAESLLRLLRLSLADEDAAIAEYLIGSLDSHGFLPATILDDAAEALRLDRARVVSALAALHRLDPPGIGARGASECLLIQLHRLREAGQAHPLAETLVRDHLRALAFRHFREVAHAVGVMPKHIEVEWAYIRAHLNPFPAHGFEAESGELAAVADLVRPDVIIRKAGESYSVEVAERQRYTLRVSPEYLGVRRQLVALAASEQDKTHVRSSIEQAQAFIAALRQRWETMQRVTESLCVAQRDYLEVGPTALQPLTRADIARKLGVHESTVSRATDGKFVLLPNGRTVPFDDFFDSSLPVRRALQEILSMENIRRPFSDEQLMHLLAQRGLMVARRTIAKYREEMNILPSRLRKQRPLGKRAAKALAARRAAVSDL